ncbi:hypothetical protein BJP62_02450 [Jeongeupia sp. USM3]|nr:hypothetical protein BJP62_02450 [Jeongeupia sp. USM3]
MFGLSHLERRGNPAERQRLLEAAGMPVIRDYTERQFKSPQRDAIWGAVHQSAFDAQPVTICYLPIYGPNGKPVSYVVSEVLVSDLVSAQRLKPYGMQLMLLDPEGKPVFVDPALKQGRQLADRIMSMRGDFHLEIDWRNARLLMFYQGLVSHWRIVYAVPLSAVIARHTIVVVISLLFLLTGLVGIFWTAREVRRRIIEPARKNAEEVIKGRDLIQTLMELAPVALCLLRVDRGTVLIQNERARELAQLEISKGEARWPLLDFFLAVPSAGPEIPHSVEVETNAPDHERRQYIVAKLMRIRYEDQPALFCAFSDVSDRKNAELALAAARDAADSANKAKSAFLAMMSHEIRTPLYGVLGTLELLGKTALSPQQHGYLGTVQQSSGNLLQIINDILDFSKIEADQLSLALAPFNAIELAEGVARNFAPLARQKGVDLYCCLQPDVPVLLGDRHRLQQVLSNLVGNAVKFTDSGKIVIRLNGREVEPGRFALDLQVTDSGIGIGKADQARLFEPFTQADDSTARRFGGTGLGLSICRKLVALMGGGIELVSETGLGSSFTVRLPLAITERPQPASLAGVALVHVQAGASDWRENLLAQIRHAGGQAQPFSATAAIGPDDILLVAGPADAGLVQGFAHVVRLTPEGAPAPEWHDDGWHVSGLCQQGLLDALRLAGGQGLHPAAAAAGGEPAAHRGLHVLVVEDHPINQLVMSDQLEQLGCTVTLVADGREALQRWRRGERYDVMLTDVNMPNLDGYALARQLRVDGIGVPIVGVTANAQPEEAARCLAAGMDAHLAKPVSLAELTAALAPFRMRSASPPANVLPHLEGLKPAMRELFVSTARADWLAVLAAIPGGDSASVVVHAHRLKGALATIGAADAVEYCARLEERAAEGAMDDTADDVRWLNDYLSPILEVLP